MREVVVLILVVAAALVTLVSAIGVAAMRDPLQRLHFVAPPPTIAAPLLAAAVFLSGQSVQAGLKAALIALLLVVTNGVATHATARAVRVRARGHWEPTPDDRAEIVRETES